MSGSSSWRLGNSPSLHRFSQVLLPVSNTFPSWYPGTMSSEPQASAALRRPSMGNEITRKRFCEVCLVDGRMMANSNSANLSSQRESWPILSLKLLSHFNARWSDRTVKLFPSSKCSIPHTIARELFRRSTAVPFRDGQRRTFPWNC